MASQTVKLIDIARELNVSVSLVSMVLSSKSAQYRISPVTAAKIMEKAKEMGYSVNNIGRALRTGSLHVIGLVVADIANAYFAKMTRYVENEALKYGYQVIVCSSDEDSRKLADKIDILRSQRVDGLILAPVENSSETIGHLQNLDIPFVLIDRYLDDVPCDSVCTDNYNAASQLVNKLVESGCRNIAAFFYDRNVSTIRDRKKAYLDVTGQSNIYVIPQDFNKEQLDEAIGQALEAGCDGLFFANNNLGINSLDILNRRGLKIGKDISMVSFDNPLVYSIVEPGITCYHQSIQEIGIKAVQLLVDKIKGKVVNGQRQKFIPGELIVRKSTVDRNGKK